VFVSTDGDAATAPFVTGGAPIPVARARRDSQREGSGAARVAIGSGWGDEPDTSQTRDRRPRSQVPLPAARPLDPDDLLLIRAEPEFDREQPVDHHNGPTHDS